MKASNLHDVWASPDNSRLTPKQFSFRLPIHVSAKIAALCDMYLQVLVDEIVVAGDTATMKGRYAALVNAVVEIKKDTSEEVPSFMRDWSALTLSSPPFRAKGLPPSPSGRRAGDQGLRLALRSTAFLGVSKQECK